MPDRMYYLSAHAREFMFPTPEEREGQRRKREQADMQFQMSLREFELSMLNGSFNRCVCRWASKHPIGKT